MTEQGALLKLMIEKELGKQKVRVNISNHLFDAPEEIKLSSDELAFISFIRIQASSDFTLEFHSPSESRTISKLITTPTVIENNIITKHLGTIKFNMSNADPYQVSVVKIKYIK